MSHSTTGPLSDSREVHARIAATLAMHADPRYRRPSQIHAYVRRHLPEHAAAGESMNEDILSSSILPYLDVATLKETSSSAELPLMRLVTKVAHAWTWEHPERNAAALRFIAAAEHHYVGPRDLPTPWGVPWAKSPGPSEILARIDSFVSLGATRLNGRIVVAMAARDQVELLDLASGQSKKLRLPSGDITAVAIGSVPGGGAIVSIGTEGGQIRCWLVQGTGPQREEWPEPEDRGCFDAGDAVTALSVVIVLSQPHIVAGHANGRVTLVDCTEEGEMHPRRLHEGQVTGITSTQLDNGTPAAVSVGVDGTVRLSHLGLWPTPVALFRSEETINAVASLQLAGGRVVTVTAGENGSVRIWELPPESPGFSRVPGHDQDVTAVAAGTGPRGEPLVVTGDSHGRLRIVDPEEVRVIGGPVAGHGKRITRLTLQRAPDGRLIAVSGGVDGIVRSWDLADMLRNAPRNAASPGAPHPQRSIRLWRWDDGTEVGGEIGTQSHRMAAVAVGRLADGTPVAVTDAGSAPQAAVGPDTTIAVTTAVLPGGDTRAVSATGVGHLRFWDLTPCPDRPPRVTKTPSHPGVRAVITARRADGRTVAVSAGGDHALKIWNLRNGQRLGSDLVGHERAVTVLAAAAAPGRGTVVSGSEDASLRVWDLDAGRQVGKTFRGYERRITALAATWVGDSLIAVTACRGEAVVRWCDLLAAVPRPGELIGHDGPVTAVAAFGDPQRPLAVTASEDHTIRVWDLIASAPLRVQGQDLGPMPVPGTVRAIACFDDAGPSAVIAGDNVLAVVRWDALDQKAAGRYQLTASAAAGFRDKDARGVSVDGAHGVQVGSNNYQVNYFVYGDQTPLPEPDPDLSEPDSDQQ